MGRDLEPGEGPLQRCLGTDKVLVTELSLKALQRSLLGPLGAVDIDLLRPLRRIGQDNDHGLVDVHEPVRQEGLFPDPVLLDLHGAGRDGYDHRHVVRKNADLTLRGLDNKLLGHIRDERFLRCLDDQEESAGLRVGHGFPS